MTQRPATTLGEINYDVASRQAIGGSTLRPKNYEELTDLVRNGTLRLHPHPDWTGDILDWSVNPFNDRNWKFQHHTLRWLNAPRWAALAGDEDARDMWRRIAYSWYESNMPAKKTAGDFAWKDMTDGTRAVQLSVGSGMLREGDDWYIELLRAHVDWLSDDKNIVGGNHGLHQNMGLIAASATLRDEQGIDIAYDRLVKQFVGVFDEQGTNNEGSVGYHQMNLQWWNIAWERLRAEGRTLPDYVEDRLTAGRIALAHMALPNGRLPLIGDTKNMNIARRIGPEAQFVDTAGEKGTPPPEKAIVLDRGYVISRSGWGENRPLPQESHTVLRHGEHLRAHSHQDRGSVHIYASGRSWLTDGGFHSYQTGDPTRAHFLTRAAHNIAHLPVLDHDDEAPVDLIRSEISETVHDFTVADRGYQGVDLTRRVLYFPDPDFWIVWDASSASTPLMQNWQVDAGLKAGRHDRGFELTSEDSSMTMTWLGRMPKLRRHAAEEGDLRGWICTGWRKTEPGTLITAESSAAQPRSAVMIAPSRPHEFGVVRSYFSVAGTISATVMRGPRLWNVRIDGDKVSINELSRDWL